MTKLEGASYGPHNDGKPGHLVILLHGYGADGNDLVFAEDYGMKLSWVRPGR